MILVKHVHPDNFFFKKAGAIILIDVGITD